MCYFISFSSFFFSFSFLLLLLLFLLLLVLLLLFLLLLLPPPLPRALKTRSSCIPGWPQTPYVAKDDLDLLILFLPLECWDCTCIPPCFTLLISSYFPHVKVHPLIRAQVSKTDPRPTARSCQIWFDTSLSHGCPRASLFHLKTVVPLRLRYAVDCRNSLCCPIRCRGWRYAW